MHNNACYNTYLYPCQKVLIPVFCTHPEANFTIVYFSGSPLHLFLGTPMNKGIQGEGSPVFRLFLRFIPFTVFLSNSQTKKDCSNGLIDRDIDAPRWGYRCSTLDI